jgi:peptidoglycan/LPS O-acetylase OafA/YrhL
MTTSREARRRLQVYLLLVGATVIASFPLPFIFDDEYEPTFTDGLVVALYFGGFVAVACAVVEITWRLLERRRLRRYGGLPRRPFSPPSIGARLVGYIVGLPVLALFGAMVGETTYDCPPDASDCDLGVINFMAGGVIALVLALVLIVSVEISLAVRRSRR